MMRRGRRVTLRDISTSLGLSVNTVSRALAGKDAVSERTRERVRAEARRLGYVPNAMARSLVVGSAMALGLVITNPSNPFYSALVSAIEQRCRLYGYSLILMVTEENMENEERAATSLLHWGLDGAIVVPVQQSAEYWSRLQDAGMPLVLVNRDLPELDCDFVGIDYAGGAFNAAAHLLSQPCDQLIIVEEDLDISSINDRIAGYTRALHAQGAPAHTIFRVPTRRRHDNTLPWDPSDAYTLARDFVPRLPPRSAIMAGSDYFALGIYRALAEAGRSVPDDVRVMGFGDHPFSAFLNPSLSSVRLPAMEIGSQAVDLLIDQINGSNSAPARRTMRLEPPVIIRASSQSGLEQATSPQAAPSSNMSD